MSGYDTWSTEIKFLKGVGPKKAELLQSEAGIGTLGDLLMFFPRKYVDRSQVVRIRDIRLDMPSVTLKGKVQGFHSEKGRRGSRLTAVFDDGSGNTVDLVWFKGAKWVKDTLKVGQEVTLFGTPRRFGRRIQIAHPEIEYGEGSGPAIAAYYPGTEKLGKAGLDSRGIRKLMTALLDQFGKQIRENLSPAILQRYGLIPREQAMRQLHFPSSFKELQAAQNRLKFEELFFFQLHLARNRLVEQPRHVSMPFPTVGDYFNTYYAEHLPFELTGAQKRVLKEIRRDLAQPIQMNRLVQGDVGSGKTMVAFMTMLIALDNGYQSAMMAPTEILAEQHYRNIQRYGGPLGIRSALLTGSVKGKSRKQLLFELKEGHIHILVGTHALIEDSVQFRKLGLAVVDEQHKFGVLQRARLWRKAGQDRYPHNMVMTATPIPRTLAMTLYGDVDVSVIDELPPGRTPVKTLVKGEPQRLEVFGFIEHEIRKGRQAYIVYPLVEESEKLDYLAVTEGYEAISRRFPAPEYRVSIVHGRMKPEVKDFEMQRFKRGETQIMVATTVIEVGVDVPNATVMVIENAEKFGLSQLHQLRGRVGRGGEQSYCILMAGKKPSEDAVKRLRAMAETTDGFRISQIDLQLRGPGDFLGTRQSGLPEFRLADIIEDEVILKEAREAAFDLLKQDPMLEQPYHRLLSEYFARYMKAQGRLIGVA